MAQRLRLYDVRVSRLPETVGLCQGDTARIAAIVNSAQRRLLYCKEAGEEGWNGGWAEIQFTVSQTSPFFTCTPDIARLEFIDICNRPVTLNNQFVEYLRFGNGRFPKIFQGCHRGCRSGEVFSRNNVPTFTDLTAPPQFLTVFPNDPSDAGKRVLLQGTDQNGNIIYSEDGGIRITGIFVSLAAPFVQTPLTFNSITGIQKDVTNGTVQIFQTDPNSGAQVLLVTMQPWETTAWYRRYYFNDLPFSCCSLAGLNPCISPPATTPTVAAVTVTALAKMDFVPVYADTDYCIIQNLEALIEESQSVRYSTMDSDQSKRLEAQKHKDAVRLLNGELNHFYGTDYPAINVAVFGSARLEHQMIGTQV